jgi:hypothetical protein
MGICLTAACCILNCSSVADDNSVPIENHFNVIGTKIYAPDGNEFLIKGVNVNGPGWVFPRDTLQDITLITDVWQFNTVRICAAIGWNWALNNNKDLDSIIKAFTEKGVVSILEVHDYTGIYPPVIANERYEMNGSYVVKRLPSRTELKKWWVDKANRFKNNPYVWFNIMNEPGSDNTKKSAELWSEIHGGIIKAIRDAGAHNIIVLDDHGWGQGSGYYGGASSYDSAIIRMGPELNKKYYNLVYSLHTYDAWRDGLSRFNQYFKDAYGKGLCIILGEFGAGKDNLSQLNAVKNMYDSAIPENIGRMYWAWDDAGLQLTEDGCGWQIDKQNGEKPGNLTWAGEMVWLDNRGLLTSPVPDYNLDLPPFTNSDFENGFPGGWSDWGGSSIQDGVSYNGSKALVISKGAPGGGGFSVELKPSTAYQFSAWGKNSAQTNSSTDVGIKYRSSPNAQQEQHHFVSFKGSTWEQKSVMFTTPAAIYGATFFLWKPDAGVAFYVDDLELITAP